MQSYAIDPSTIGKRPIIALGSNEWSDYWMPRQQYLSRLGARGWRVIYSPGTKELRRIMSAGRRADLTLLPRFERTSNIVAYRPGLIFPRWRSHPLIDRLAIASEVRYLKRMAGTCPTRPVVIMTSPLFADYLDHFDDHPVVYFTEDAYNLMPGWTDENHRQQERVVRRADLIITCATSMAEQLPGDGPRRAKILRNGVDYAAFAEHDGRPCPDDLAAVPRPRIGYIGSINLKVDFTLVATVARRRPDWHWVLVGPVGVGSDNAFRSHPGIARAFAECRSLPNVHFLGRKPFSDLPAYARHMDVNTMCYRTDEGGWWKAIDPLKTNEYLASGRPVVSADLINVRPFADCLDIARNEEEWMVALERALHDDMSERIARGQARALQNDWAGLTDQFESWLLELAHAPAAAAPDPALAATQTQA